MVSALSIAALLLSVGASTYAPPTSRDDKQSYKCMFTTVKPPLKGKLVGAWENAKWTSAFIDIRNTSFPAPATKTRVKMLWDKKFLYVGAHLQETHVWGNLTERNSALFSQNAFEMFIDGDGDGNNYYEFQMNALNTITEIALDKPYSQGGQVSNGEIPGLITAVHVEGTINNPSDTDKFWSVTIAVPWKGLKRYNTKKGSIPPKPNDKWRMQFARTHREFQIVDGKYERLPKGNMSVWTAQNKYNMHIPEQWGTVTFVK